MGERLAGKPVVQSLRDNILSRVDKLNTNGYYSNPFINQGWST